MKIGHRLTTNLPLILKPDIAAHVLQHLEQPGTRGVEADPANDDIRSRYDERGNDGKCRRRRIARHDDVLRLQAHLARDGNDARAVCLAFHRNVRAKALQHPFAMITRRHGFDHAGDARYVQAGQQHRRFHLGGGNGQAIFDRHGGHDAAHHGRQGATRRGGNIGAHQAEGIDHPAHRAMAERCIAGKGAADGMA